MFCELKYPYQIRPSWLDLFLFFCCIRGFVLLFSTLLLLFHIICFWVCLGFLFYLSYLGPNSISLARPDTHQAHAILCYHVKEGDEWCRYLIWTFHGNSMSLPLSTRDNKKLFFLLLAIPFCLSGLCSYHLCYNNGIEVRTPRPTIISSLY